MALGGGWPRFALAPPSASDLPGAFVEVPESTVVILDADEIRSEPFLAAD